MSKRVLTNIPAIRFKQPSKKRYPVPPNSSSTAGVPTPSQPTPRHNRAAIRLATLLRGTIGI